MKADDRMKKAAFIAFALLTSVLSVRVSAEDLEIKEYYNAITSDMSWYSEDLDSITLTDLTGDGIPEFIASINSDKDGFRTPETSASDVIRKSKTYRKFYTIDGTKLVYMGAMSLSADRLYPYDDNGTIRWVYSDCDMVEYGSGEYYMTRDYGYITVSDNRLRRKIMFHAYENVDISANVFYYIYKTPDIVERKSYKDYSKNTARYIDEADKASVKWTEQAEKWERSLFPSGLPMAAVLDTKTIPAGSDEQAARDALYELIDEYLAGQK